MTIENIGQILQEKRQEMGLSLRDVASTLRVGLNALESIESNEYDTKDVYILGYIRLYSKYLGMNIEVADIKKDIVSALGVNSCSDEVQHAQDVAVAGTPSLRVVIIASVFFVTFFLNNGYDDREVLYINKLNAGLKERIVVKDGGQTYIVHKHNAPLVIKASDSVEVSVFASDNRLLDRLYVRVGEVVPFPVNNQSTIVRTNIPDAIDISTKD